LLWGSQARTSLFVGSLIIALGYGASLPLLGSTWGLMIVTCVCALGVAFAYGSMPALIMSAVPQSETAAATSFNTLMRSIGTSVSAAVVGVVLAHMTVSFGGHTLPSEDGFRVGMMIGCGVALLAAAITLTLPGHPPSPPSPEPASSEPPPPPQPAPRPPPRAPPPPGHSAPGAVIVREF